MANVPIALPRIAQRQPQVPTAFDTSYETGYHPLNGGGPVTSMDTRIGPAAPTQPQQGPVAPTSNFYQASKDIAEQSRNYTNQFRGFANNQNNWTDTTNGQQAGEGGAGTSHTVNWDQQVVPTWNGPKANALSGVKSGAEFLQGDEGNVQAMLAKIRQFDPNAKVVSDVRDMGGDNPQQQQIYRLQFDDSKMPKEQYAGTVAAGSNDLYNSSDSALRYDPNYGVVTGPKNIRNDPTWLDTYGPLLVGGFGALAGGAGAAASLLQRAPGMVNSFANGQFNPFQIAQMASGFIPGMPSWGGKVIGAAGQLYNANRRGG